MPGSLNSKPSLVPGKYDSCVYVYNIYIYIDMKIYVCTCIYMESYTSLIIFAVRKYFSSISSISTYSIYNCQGPASNFGESIFHFRLVAGESKEAVGHTKASGHGQRLWDPEGRIQVCYGSVWDEQHGSDEYL